MIKKIIFKISKVFLSWTATFIFDYIDKDSDGKLSKKELEDLIKKIRSILKK